MFTRKRAYHNSEDTGFLDCHYRHEAKTAGSSRSLLIQVYLVELIVSALPLILMAVYPLIVAGVLTVFGQQSYLRWFTGPDEIFVKILLVVGIMNLVVRSLNLVTDVIEHAGGRKLEYDEFDVNHPWTKTVPGLFNVLAVAVFCFMANAAWVMLLHSGDYFKSTLEAVVLISYVLAISMALVVSSTSYSAGDMMHYHQKKRNSDVNL